MVRLWERMLDAYGPRWESAYGTVPNKAWTDGLAGITPEMIGTGLSRLLKSEEFKKWPPNVFEFRDMCSPKAEDYGLPDYDEAYWQAVNWGRVKHDDKHQAVLHAMREYIDMFGCRRLAEKEARRIFDTAWKKTIDHVAAGGELPEIPVEIPEELNIITEKGQAAGRAAMLKAMRK